MTEVRRSKIIARGSDAFCALVMTALDECVNLPIHDLPKRDFFIEEHTSAEFKQRKFVFPNGKPNQGRVVKKGLLWVNGSVSAGRIKHVTRHEIAHVIPLSVTQQAQLMALMVREDGSHPTKWDKGEYADRPYEAAADTIAEAASGIDSPWDDFELYGCDFPDESRVIPIVKAQGGLPGPEPTPEPTPPIDPRITALEAEVADLNIQLMSMQLTIINARTFRDKAIEDLQMVAP